MSAEARGIALVTGATGFIGSAVVRALLARGRPVRCYVEPGASRRSLDGLEVEVIEGDINDRRAVGRALEGVATLYHLAALYRLWTRDREAIYQVNVEGSKTVLFAALAAGVSKVVYTSSIAALGPAPSGQLIDERTEFSGWHEADHYIRSKWLSERDALRFAREGLPLVVVNPAFPFGARDGGPTPTGRFITTALKRRVPGVARGGFNAVDVDDVAEAHVLAEERGRVGERYILGEHNVSYLDFFRVVTEQAGLPPIDRRVPRSLVLGASWLVEKAMTARGVEPPTTYKAARYATRTFWFDTTKAHDELGMPRTPLEVSVRKAIDWFRQNGYA